MQLTDRISLVASGAEGFGLTHRSDCHVYLIDGGTEMALIDSGAGVDDSLLARLGSMGVERARVGHLFITHAHPDHAGGAALVREATGAAVSCSPEVAAILREGDERGASVDVGKAQGTYSADYAYRASPVDAELVDGQRVRVGEVEIEVVATPGHSTGHTCYLLHDGDRTDLFTGDMLLFGGRIILQDIWDCDLRAQFQSLRHLAEHTFDGFFPGHRTISITDGRRHLETALAALDRGAIPPTFF